MAWIELAMCAGLVEELGCACFGMTTVTADDARLLGVGVTFSAAVLVDDFWQTLPSVDERHLLGFVDVYRGDSADKHQFFPPLTRFGTALLRIQIYPLFKTSQAKRPPLRAASFERGSAEASEMPCPAQP